MLELLEPGQGISAGGSMPLRLGDGDVGGGHQEPLPPPPSGGTLAGTRMLTLSVSLALPLPIFSLSRGRGRLWPGRLLCT